MSIPGLASKGGKRFVTADSNGTLSTSNYTINDYETALKKVDDAVSSVGALAAAMSAIPNVTTGDNVYGCGIGTGVFGSAWVGAAGCSAKLNSQLTEPSPTHPVSELAALLGCWSSWIVLPILIQTNNLILGSLCVGPFFYLSAMQTTAARTLALSFVFVGVWWSSVLQARTFLRAEASFCQELNSSALIIG